MPDGRIEPRQVERFEQIGAWLTQYGKTIYGTRGGPFRPTSTLASTHTDRKVYVHVLDWARDAVVLPPIERKILSSNALTGGTATVRQTAERIEIAVPEAHRHSIDTIVALELDGPAAGLAPGRLASGSLAAGKPARASNTFQKSATYSPDKAFDDDPETRWGCDWGTKAAWLEVDLGKPTTVGRAVISEPYGRVQEFALEYRDGDDWRTFARGKTIGERRVLTFRPVTARIVRLNLLRCTEGPSIWEFQLFPP
jgi:alpha-L-fucosidase